MSVPAPPSTPKTKPSAFPGATPRTQPRPKNTSSKTPSLILTPSRSPLDEQRAVEAVQNIDLARDDDSASVVDNGPQAVDDEPRHDVNMDDRRGSVSPSVVSHDESVVQQDELCDNCVNKHLAMAKWARAQHDKERDIAFHKEFEDRFIKQREEANAAAAERKKELTEFIRKSKEEREAEMARRSELEDAERKMDREMIEAARRQLASETAEARAARQEELRNGLKEQIEAKKAKAAAEREEEAQQNYEGLISPSRIAVEDARKQKLTFRDQLAEQIDNNKKMRAEQAARERAEDEARMAETMYHLDDQKARAEEAERRRKEEAAEYEREIEEKRQRRDEGARRAREEALEGKRIADQLEEQARRDRLEHKARQQSEFADTLADQLRDKEARRERERERDRMFTSAPIIPHTHGPMVDCAECGSKFELRRLLGSPARAALDSWKKYLTPKKPSTEHDENY